MREIVQGSTLELCPSSWNLVHRSTFSSKAWMSLAASLMSLRSTCLCWVIPLTLRTLRARSLFTTGASSQSRNCVGYRVKQCEKIMQKSLQTQQCLQYISMSLKCFLKKEPMSNTCKCIIHMCKIHNSLAKKKHLTVTIIRLTVTHWQETGIHTRIFWRFQQTSFMFTARSKVTQQRLKNLQPDITLLCSHPFRKNPQH